jgi:tetraacyldisaccharide 4'-kinase
MIEPSGRIVEPAPGTRVLALAGIARPDSFVRSLHESGWVVAGELFFRDHHPYEARDIALVVAAAREAHAVLVVTTEKDLMRLLPLRPFPVPVAVLPYRLAIEPAAQFRTWLNGRLAGWRAGREAPARDKGSAAQ